MIFTDSSPLPTRPVAFVASKTGPVSNIKNLTWPAISQGLGKIEVGSKDGAGWVPAEIDLGPRTQDRVKSVHTLVLDIEATSVAEKDAHGGALRDRHGDIVKRATGPEPPDFDDLLAEVELWGWRGLLHTSYGHLNPETLPIGIPHPRYRLVLDLSRPLVQPPVGEHEIKLLAPHVAWLLNIKDCLDTSTVEPARLFYLPRCPQDRLGLFRSEAVDGAPIDVDALLKEAARVTAAVVAKASHGKKSGSVIEAFNAAHDVGAILKEAGYRPKGCNRWLWPDSTTGMPGVRLLPNSNPERVYSSHGSDPLSDGHAHDAFDLWRILRHGGDQRQAIKSAAQLLGMSERPTAQSQPDILITASTVDALFEDVTLRKEDIDKMADAEFLVPNMVVRGHMTAYVSPGNGGKTTIFIYLCEKLCRMGLKVLYINVDGSPGDLKRHFAHAEKHGYKVVAPDARDGKSTDDVVQKLRTLAASEMRCDDYVFILDTLKKYADVIDKRQAKGLYKLMRSLTVKGATVCMLGHTNKYKDEDGKAIFEGTADLRNDADDLIYLDSFKNEANNTLEITTRPDKVRAEFNPTSYVIYLDDDRRVAEPAYTFNILSKEEREILDLVKEAIRAGHHAQKEIVADVKGKSIVGDKKIRAALHHHTQVANPEIKVETTGRGTDLRYSLVDHAAEMPPLEDEVEEIF